MIESIVSIVQIVSAILLVLTILVQKSDAGVGGAFGGSDSDGDGHTQRRGSEKVIFIATFCFTFIFLASIILPLIVELG